MAEDWTDILIGHVISVELEDDGLTIVLQFSDGRRIIVTGDSGLSVAEENVPEC